MQAAVESSFLRTEFYIPIRDRQFWSTALYSKEAQSMTSIITLHDISSQHLSAPVSYAVLRPDREEPLPLCLLLLGAGATRDSLCDLQELFDTCWAEGSVP